MVAGVPNIDFLGHAATLLRSEGATCLGLELKFVALWDVSCVRESYSEAGLGGKNVLLSQRVDSEAR